MYKTILISFLFFQTAFSKDVFVNGYMKSNGTYVQPHYRSAPDGNVYNNWSTVGNTNPYTGVPGSVNPTPVYNPPSLPTYNLPTSPNLPSYGY